MGYIDDLEFAKFWALDRQERGRFGPRRVRRELAQKGVAPEIIDRVLEPLQNTDTQRERATALLEKWNRTARQQDPRRRRAAAANYLARRGFDPEIIRELLHSFLKDEDNGPEVDPNL
jgi:regulatory protein